jgi:hypothetical protein
MHAQFYAVSKEIRVSRFIRQFHRWTSLAFVLSVIATTIALMQKEPVIWMSYVPLLPLALLAITGMYMFFLPYFAGRRSGSGGQGAAS